jgi:hypothetical protein
MRKVRMSIALALLAALLVQSVVAIAAPREARAGGRAPIVTPSEYMRVPQPADPGRPVRYVPKSALPKDKDPRHC